MTSKPSVLPSAALRRTLAAAVLLGLAPIVAEAATISVTSPDDSDPAAADTCTLRQAIVSMNEAALKGQCANTGAAFGTDDTITFAASSVGGGATPGTIVLADSADTSGSVGGTLVVAAQNLSIDAEAWRGDGSGQYAGGVTIARASSATNGFGILRDIAPTGASLALAGLTLHGGNMSGGDCVANSQGAGLCIPEADLSMRHCVVSGNSAMWAGGVYGQSGTLTIVDSTISGNDAPASAGGIYVKSGSLILVDSTVSGNSTLNAAGGIYIHDGSLRLERSTVSGNTAKAGGGLYVYPGTLELIDSTISGNSALSGGGIFSYTATVLVSNSTIAGNTAEESGGGVRLFGSTFHANRVTIAQNSAQQSGGGIFGGDGDGGDGADVKIDGSIVAGNTQPDDDIVLDSAWSGSGNIVSAAGLALGPLQDNGGPTWTMLPGTGSSAIDAVDCAGAPAADQRGVPRPQGSACDIGAVELVQDRIFADNFDGRPTP